MTRKSSKILPAIYISTTLIAIGITFVVLSILPKSTVVELDVFARRVSFVLSPDADDLEVVPLLYSSVWTNSINIEKFQPIKLTVDSLYTTNQEIAVKNPIVISAKPHGSRITFSSSSPNISNQKIFASVGSNITLGLNEYILAIDVQHSNIPPSQTISFPDLIEISVQNCNVTDGSGNNLTQLFESSVKARLHKISRSVTVLGEGGELAIRSKEAPEDSLREVQFLLKRPVTKLNFTEYSYQNHPPEKMSTIDSLFVKLNYPLQSNHFKTRGPDDLGFQAEPNSFTLFELSKKNDLLRILAGERLKSLKVYQGAITQELVPGFLSYITHHPTMVMAITWLGWILTIFIPLVSKLKSKFQEDKHV